MQLCAEDNMQVVVPSTPAQAYHMLRRQILRPLRRPLIVMSPKSLLRHRLAVSTLEDLAEGEFQAVIDDVELTQPEKVDRVVLCSGKVYFDLLETRREHNLVNVALVRMEQLYPFPYDEVKAALAHYAADAKVVWCQEEPRNQGAWRANRHQIERCFAADVGVEFAGRMPSASPAVGYANAHQEQQKKLVQEALGMVPNSQES